MTLETSNRSETDVRRGRILVGIDGSSASRDALDWAAREADLTHSTLEIVMTWDWPTTYGWAVPLPDGYDPAEGIADLLSKTKATVCAKYPDLEVNPRVVQGHPSPSLVEASKEADLLVVGSRGHGEFVGMLIGSVSEYCAVHALITHRPRNWGYGSLFGG